MYSHALYLYVDADGVSTSSVTLYHISTGGTRFINVGSSISSEWLMHVMNVTHLPCSNWAAYASNPVETPQLSCARMGWRDHLQQILLPISDKMEIPEMDV